MGTTSSWLVCDAEHLEDVKGLLGVTDKPEGREPEFSAFVSSRGQLLVFECRGGREWRFDGEEERRRLSVGREVIFCTLMTSVDWSEIAQWKDGEEVWRVSCLLESGDGLEVRGEVPECLERVKREVGEDEDGEPDEFSVPMALARELTGFDGEGDGAEEWGKPMEWVGPERVVKRGWFARWFGGKR